MALRRDEERQVGPGGWQQDRVACGHPSPVQRRAAGPDQARDHVEGFREPADLVIGRIPERLELRVVPAGSDPEDQAAAADVVECGRHLRLERRVAEPGAEHDRAQLDTLGRLRDRRKDRPALMDAGLLAAAPEQQVVEHPDRIEARRLGGERDIADLGVGRDPVAVVLIGDRQHDPDLRHQR